MFLVYLFSIVIFVIGYFAIALEHPFKISKSAVALLMGATLWLLAAVAATRDISHSIFESGGDIFGIVVFLLAAMALVEVLVHYHFFDIIRGKLYTLGLNDRRQLIVIAGLAFVLSGVIDNLTTTIVMIQIARGFFGGKNLLRAVTAIVIAANAGGAFSPIGDVTTIMIWLAEKFNAAEIISWGFLPSFALFAVSTFLISRPVSRSTKDQQTEIITTMSRSERGIVALVFLSFLFPLGMNFFGLPPYLGLLFGLALVWLSIDLLKQFRPRQTHLDASIDDMIRKTDIPSLKFFIGILLAVSALNSLGILEYLSSWLYGDSAGVSRIIFGNVALGLISAVLDNVPLTAIALEILPDVSPALWALLALTVGTGGSLLVVGSAAGVIAMGMVKELSFMQYLRIAFVPAITGFTASVLVWALQYSIFT